MVVESTDAAFPLNNRAVFAVLYILSVYMANGIGIPMTNARPIR